MTPELLKKSWKSDLLTVSDTQLSKFPFKEITKEFLYNGIIDECGELSFDDLTEDLQTVNDQWNLENKYYDRFVTIGFNGSGDPVAIDLMNNDRVVYLNHDNDFEEILINENIERLLETVFRIEAFSSKKTQLTKESYYFTEFSDEDYKTLVSDLKFIDPKIFEEDSFWKDTVEYWLWEREEERKKAGNKCGCCATPKN